MMWINQFVGRLRNPASLNLFAKHRQYISWLVKTIVPFVLLTVSGCYVPTRDRLCRDLRVPPVRCKDDVSLRNELLSAFPLGIQTQELRKGLNDIVQRDPLAQLREYEQRVELLVNFEVHGFAVCKETITARFQTANDVLTNVAVGGAQICL